MCECSFWSCVCVMVALPFLSNQGFCLKKNQNGANVLTEFFTNYKTSGFLIATAEIHVAQTLQAVSTAVD